MNNIATPREKEILDAIIHFIEKKQYPPTIREIGELVKLKSTSSVQAQLIKMVEKGLIESDCLPRTIRVPGYKFVKDEPEYYGGKL